MHNDPAPRYIGPNFDMASVGYDRAVENLFSGRIKRTEHWPASDAANGLAKFSCLCGYSTSEPGEMMDHVKEMIPQWWAVRFRPRLNDGYASKLRIAVFSDMTPGHVLKCVVSHDKATFEIATRVFCTCGWMVHHGVSRVTLAVAGQEANAHIKSEIEKVIYGVAADAEASGGLSAEGRTPDTESSVGSGAANDASAAGANASSVSVPYNNGYVQWHC